VDGTRIKAVNNKDRNFTRASLTRFIKAADAKLENEAVLDRMQARIAQRREILDNAAKPSNTRLARSSNG